MRKRKKKRSTSWKSKVGMVALLACLGLFTTVAYAATPVTTDSTASYNAGTVNVESYLNLREGAGTDYDIIGHIFPGTEVDVLSTEGDWYKVSAPEGEGYVYGDYLNLFQKAEETTDTSTSDSSEDETTSSDTGLTPTGNMTLVDDIDVTEDEEDSSDSTSISGTTQSGAVQQFITLTTRDGNYFYLIIDRDTNGSENVHFLNMVDESDLMALIDDQEADEDNVLITEDEALTEEEELALEEAEAAMEEELEEGESSGVNVLPMVVVVLVAAGGVGYYFYRRKKSADAVKAQKPDPDADYGVAEEDEESDNAYDLPEDDDDMDIQYFNYDDDQEE